MTIARQTPPGAVAFLHHVNAYPKRSFVLMTVALPVGVVLVKMALDHMKMPTLASIKASNDFSSFFDNHSITLLPVCLLFVGAAIINHVFVQLLQPFQFRV